MAFSTDGLSATEIALFNAGKPIFAANASPLKNEGPALLAPDVDVQWRESGSFTSGVDASDPDFPTLRVSDDLSQYRTQPDASANVWHLMYDLSIFNGIEFDFIALINTPMAADGVTDFKIQIDNASNFPAPTTIISLVPPANDPRYVFWQLDGGHFRFRSLEFIRFRFEGVAITPRVGQIVLGRRRQLEHRPNRPYNADLQFTLGSVFTARSGAKTRYTQNRKGRRLEARMPIAGEYVDFVGADRQFSQDVVDWWPEIKHGNRVFYWAEDPVNENDRLYMMSFPTPRPGLRFPHTGGLRRTLSLSANEQGPNYFGLE